MARGRLRYDQRMRAARVSSHTVTPMPTIRQADLAATPYQQTWSPVEMPWHSSVTFMVLALDEAHAIALGRLRLRAMGDDPETSVVVQSAMAWSANVIAGILEVESSEEAALRQRVYEERGQAT